MTGNYTHTRPETQRHQTIRAFVHGLGQGVSVRHRCHAQKGPPGICLASRLIATDPRFEPYARQKHCAWMDAARIEAWEEVRALLLKSYRLNAPGDRPPKRASTTARKKRPKTNR